MINHPERNQENVVLPRQLIVEQDELVFNNGRVSLTVKIVNGYFGDRDIQSFSQRFPEYAGKKIDWAPTYQPVTTLRSNLNTVRIYEVQGRLAVFPQE